MTESLTPMMRQYHEVKRKLPGKLIFFRLGDFYEMFFEDAVVAARELEITLTARNKDKSGAPIPMCGVPHHAVEGYVARLIKKGYKVAICEQLEEPRPGKLVKREVTRIVTPGTVTEDVMLEPNDNNFLASILQRGDGFGAAFLDISTGDFQATEFRGDELNERLIVELNHFQPSEILHPRVQRPALPGAAARRHPGPVGPQRAGRLDLPGGLRRPHPADGSSAPPPWTASAWAGGTWPWPRRGPCSTTSRRPTASRWTTCRGCGSTSRPTS